MRLNNFLAPIDNKRDTYFLLISTSWPKAISLFFLCFILINIIFGFIFTFIPDSVSHETPNFIEAFYFSIQTLTTIGYGNFHPTGNIANFIVMLEAFCGILYVAIVTGIVFARISKPFAQIRFSKNLVLAKFDGEYCLSFRIGNTRENDLVDGKVHFAALINEVTQEGQTIRRVHDLKTEKKLYSIF
jgi:inward rectifier potassium channel